MLRSRLAWLSVLALVPLAGMAAVSACGGDNNPANDAGPDVTADVAKDVTPDVAKSDASDASCANDVDLTQFLPSADASIDVDAGGLGNIAQCTDCLKTQCGTDINTCNQDCACRQSIIDAVTCIGQGGSFQQCGGEAVLTGDQNVQNLFSCALGQCGPICLPSGDAGTKDSGVADVQSGG